MDTRKELELQHSLQKAIEENETLKARIASAEHERDTVIAQGQQLIGEIQKKEMELKMYTSPNLTLNVSMNGFIGKPSIKLVGPWSVQHYNILTRYLTLAIRGHIRDYPEDYGLPPKEQPKKEGDENPKKNETERKDDVKHGKESATSGK